MALDSVRYPELPSSNLPEGADLIAFYKYGTDTLYRTPLSNILPVQDASYAWNDAVNYSEGRIVTFEGKIWESLTDNNFNNPPEEGAGFWTEQSKAKSGLALWAAQAYFDEDVSVYYVLSGVLQLFRLEDPTRPFNSVDFLTEFAANQWKKIGSSGAASDEFVTNPTLVLSGGKTFGKYLNGQTPLWSGLTAVEAILDAIIEYIYPVLSGFYIGSQPTIVERGTVLSGSKVFIWSYSANSGAIALVDIYDVTAGATLLLNTANDGAQAQVITSNTLSAENETQQWKLIGHNTSPVGNIDSNTFTVIAKLKFWYASVSAFPVNSAAIRALANSDWYSGSNQFILNTGTVNNKFVFVQKAGKTWTVIDLDNLSLDISGDFTVQSTISVLDAGGVGESMDVIGMTAGAPYDENHRFQITLHP